ncbi:methyl-accepting chemotaxis protein [Laribacter hongkongensis]|uniref:Methyl-accepting chemotaxis protein n=1 Tax=Laribacter hongkongensis TaxID=168471 RepID=A0ABD4SUE7_9NEIS|nr:methyl-accepting chemotaxis protein [Laribacter hongkongensis]MCG9027426.1 methyl-accepting chemotaxis protein [Laribacter hongkongensis]MCG9100149.1 methyl-accepting chemotaxis protein [Laribacter hongkongensis]MCG9102558.1 methyl-accepting chemotaxis protein [Laribacter hongkongensis]MCG9114213.1 methyl-accepting chemotaxis protein [Laribacter hongkongensis]MCG9119911.1 methyl-accepting chemotaxis protein [Laribacter hongkongensis]
MKISINPSSIKTKVMMVNAIIIIAISIALSSMSYFEAEKMTIDTLTSEFTATTKDKKAIAEIFLKEKSSQLMAIKTIPDNRSYVSELMATLARAGGFTAAFIVYPDKSHIFSDGWSAPADFSFDQREWYSQALADDKIHISNPYISASNGKLTITISKRLNTPSGVHVLAGDVGMDELITNMKKSSIRGNGIVYLLKKNGDVIYYPNQNIKNITEASPELTPEKIHEVTLNSNLVKITRKNGTSAFVFMEPIDNTDWVVGVSTSTETILNPLFDFLVTLIVIALIATVVAMIVNKFVLDRAMSGVTRLRDAMKNIASGDADLTHRVIVKGKDEIAEVANYFNQFVTSLQELILSLKTSTNNLINDIGTASKKTQELALGSVQIKDASSSNAATLEEISVSIASISDGATETDQMIQGTNIHLDRSVQNVDQLAGNMNDITRVINELHHIIQTLEEKSGDISKITGIIGDIADQTNLLALNASIEAARAGEYGRGFAVVADEVRKLAERTVSATVEINDTIEAVKSETVKASNDMEKTVSVVSEGQKISVKIKESIDCIRDAMMEVTRKMTEVSHSTTEQKDAGLLIAQSTEEINRQIEQNDFSIQEINTRLKDSQQVSLSIKGDFDRFKA